MRLALRAAPFALAIVAAAPVLAQPRQPDSLPDFKEKLLRQFNRCATIAGDQAFQRATLQVTLDRRGNVVGEPRVIDPGDNEAAKSFERVAREGLKSCGPYTFVRRNPAAYARWRDMTITVNSGALRRDPGWAGGRVLSGGAAEPVNIVLKPGQDFAAMGAFTTIGGQCEVIGQGRVTIERQAKVGRVRSYVGPSPARFDEGHRLSHCNGKIIDGTTVRYDRRGRKPGQDSFRFTVRFGNGEIRIIDATVMLQ